MLSNYLHRQHPIWNGTSRVTDHRQHIYTSILHSLRKSSLVVLRNLAKIECAKTCTVHTLLSNDVFLSPILHTILSINFSFEWNISISIFLSHYSHTPKTLLTLHLIWSFSTELVDIHLMIFFFPLKMHTCLNFGKIRYLKAESDALNYASNPYAPKCKIGSSIGHGTELMFGEVKYLISCQRLNITKRITQSSL